jgi:hypothetical protein
MRKKTFVPSADFLESRIALSGGIRFIHGVPLLTTRAINSAVSIIHSSLTTFATRGQNYNLLSANLTKASNLIPWARTDLSPDTGDTFYVTLTQDVVADLKANIQAGVAKPVISAYKEALTYGKNFIAQEVANGRIVVG